MEKNKGWYGNSNLKPFGYLIDYTKEQLQEYIKCQDDVIYFIENYCKVVSLDFGLVPFDLYDYQKRFIETIHNNRWVIAKVFRQGGKSQTVAAYILHYTLFNSNKTAAILANKSSAAREIMSRYQDMYEDLPMFLQQGVKEWNKGSVELENGSKVFTAATSSSGIRGKSCVTGDTKVCLEHNDKFFYVEIDKHLYHNQNDESVKKYARYKTTNKITEKTYTGIHSFTGEILRNHTDSGSCFDDGYLGSVEIKDALEKYGPQSFCQDIVSMMSSPSQLF